MSMNIFEMGCCVDINVILDKKGEKEVIFASFCKTSVFLLFMI